MSLEYSELMAHVGEEFRLRAVRRLGRAARHHQLALEILALGDLLDGALVVERLAALIADQPGVFLHPDPLAALMAIDLGFEVPNLAVAGHRFDEFLAPLGADIPFLADVLDREDQFFR
jgi:hypothetical protein